MDEGYHPRRLRFRLGAEQVARTTIAVRAERRSLIKERSCQGRGVESVKVALLFMRRQGRCYILIPKGT
jgi:hypothetical protein